MKNSFEIKRLARTIKYDWSTNRKLILSYLAVGLGLLAILAFLNAMSNSNIYGDTRYGGHYDFSRDDDPMYEFQEMLLFLSVYAVAAFSGSLLMADLSDKRRRITALMLPAMQSEKFLSKVAIYLIAMPVVFFAGMAIVEGLRVIILHSVYPKCNFIEFFHFKYNDGTVFLRLFIPIGLAIQATYALGSTVWPSKSFIKTSLFIIVLDALIFWWCFMVYDFLGGRRYREESIIDIETWHAYIPLIITIVNCIIVYTISYLRYKEIEIIQRW